MFDILSILHFSVLTYSVPYVRLYPILMSILLYDYKQLTQCISEVERIEAKVNSSKKKEWLTKKEQEKEEVPPLYPRWLFY
jgi:hypothetical protein